MKSLAACLLAGALTLSAFAQRETFTLRPDASTVKITLNTNHDIVHGEFHAISGTVEFDRVAGKMSG